MSLAPDEKATFCRICEPLCGMVATVQDGRLTKLRPDKDHPLSRGFACPKGIAFTDVQNDPDRVLHPLRRTPSGDFERVGWDEALADITARLKEVIGRHGGSAVGWYFGNPTVFSASHTLWLQAFLQLVGTRHAFSAGSQDVNQRFVASELLYGSPLAAPVPDLARTDLLVIMGANPLVSHGSVLSAPRIKEDLHGIVERGGRVVVVDPRRTETARAFEWLPIRPDGDAMLLLSLLHVLFAEGLADSDALSRQATGADGLRALVEPFAPETTEAAHDVPPAEVRALAHALATTPRAAVYGRTGTSLGRFPTLTTALLDMVNLVAGNLDREGGAMFGDLGIPGTRTALSLARLVDLFGRRRRSRVGGFPSVLGTEPATMMAKEITTPGRGQVRALFVSAGNPVLSVPDGDELEAALEQLDLMVSLDLYVNETNAHADYVLPATTMYERADFPIAFQTTFTTPFRQATEAVVAPAGEAREEWTVIEALLRGLWRSTPQLTLREGLRRALAVARIELHPDRLVDGMVRLAEGGDRFGLRRGGLNLRKLAAEAPHGVKLADGLRPGRLRDLVLHRDRRVRLDVPELREEVERLQTSAAPDSRFPLSLIGMRELRSENSWMHNAPLLLRGGRTQRARMHPADAAAIGAASGDRLRVSTRHGSIEVAMELTEDIKPGVIAVPHGWGHKGTGGWQRANAASGGGGANVNRLMSADPADVEWLAGMANLNGVPARAEVAEHAARNGAAAAGAAKPVA